MRYLFLVIALFTTILSQAQVYNEFEYRPFNLPSSNYISSFDLCDFNSDGLFDIFLARQSQNGLEIKIKLNEGDSLQFSLGKLDSLSDYSNVISNIKNPVHIVASDIDNDGDNDIYLCEVDGFGIKAFVKILENTSNGNSLSFILRDIPSLQDEYIQSIPSVFDFDEDGVDDVIISNFDGRNSFYKNNQDFTFSLVGINLFGLENYLSPISCTVVPTINGDSSIFAFNFEKDFHLFSSTKNNGKYILSDEEFMANPDTLRAKFYQVKSGDFNYDGHNDIFFSSLTYTVDKGYFTQTWLLKGADACDFTLQLSSEDITAEYFEASSNIKSNAVIQSPNKLDLSAGKFIILEPGFSVNRGAVFKAIIEGCKN